MIKYKYAKDENEELIEIGSLDREIRNKKKFICIGCGNELIARLGEIKVRHFAHKKVVTCSGETYLHLLGKHLFFVNYSNCLNEKKPFTIEIYQEETCNHYENELGLRCNFPKTTKKFDLTQFFNKISIEKKEDTFIADIMLTSKNGKDKVFVEIAVTHQSTEQKLNSNYRIIELEIENEEDFEPIKSKNLSEKEPKIKFINFKNKQIYTSLCQGNCRKVFNFFFLDNDGRCLLKQKNLKQIEYLLSSEKERIVKYEISKDNGKYYPEIFKKGVATLSQENFKVKNCFVCRYHAENNSWQYDEDTSGNPIFCKFLKIKCNSNQAVGCGFFKLEKNYIQDILTTIKEYEKEMEKDYDETDEGDISDDNWLGF